MPRKTKQAHKEAEYSAPQAGTPPAERPRTYRATNGKILPTYKERAFAASFVKHKRNGTKAALEVYDIQGKNKRNVASVIASENLAKPRVLAEIEWLCREQGL